MCLFVLYVLFRWKVIRRITLKVIRLLSYKGKIREVYNGCCHQPREKFGSFDNSFDNSLLFSLQEFIDHLNPAGTSEWDYE